MKKSRRTENKNNNTPSVFEKDDYQLLASDQA
jgi:hypothetical protein